jgi:hypothetical protein
MSRTQFSFRRPRRRGTFRPRLEVLENRLAPGSLWGHDALTPGNSEDPDLALLVAAAASSQQGVVTTTSPVVDFATHSIVFGESTVMRTENGITAHLTASGLPPGVYTFWMRVDAPGVAPAAGRLDGHVVGESGNVTFSGHVNVGDIVGNPSIPGLEGTLQDPLHAKITLVVRSHGPADPGRIHEQTHSFESGVAFNFLVSVHAPRP